MATLQLRLENLAARIAVECKSLRTLIIDKFKEVSVKVRNPLAEAIIYGGISGKFKVQISLIGDSISMGTGASAAGSTSFASLIRDIINENQDGGYGYEDSCNFDISANASGLTSHDGTFGTAGPIKQSLVLAPTKVLTFGGNFQIVDLFYERSPGAGSAEIRRDGVLVSTKPMSGATASNICTYTGATVSTANKNSVWTITAIGGTIEITGLIRRRVMVGNYAWLTRIGKSGQVTADYTSPAQIASILAMSSYDAQKNVYIIATGLNDYTSATKGVPVAEFITNLRGLVASLSGPNKACVLTVCTKANEAITPPRFEPHEAYRKAIYSLGDELNLLVIDQSVHDLIGQSAMIDSLHVNDFGHNLLAATVLKTLAIPIVKPQFRMIADLTNSDVWTFFTAQNQPTISVVGNWWRTSGSSQSNGSASLVSANVPAGARPDRSLSFASVGGGADGIFKISFGTNGDITMGSTGRAYCFYDGMSGKIRHDLP